MPYWEAIAAGIGALGSIGGGLIGASKSSDGFSQAGAGQQAVFDYNSAGLKAKTLLKYARKAKIHPLAALGHNMSTTIAGQSGDNRSIGYGVQDALKGIGQDISNATSRNQNAALRALQAHKLEVELDREKAHAELLRAQARQLNNNPPAPTVGDNNPPAPTVGDGQIQIKPQEIIPGVDGASHGSNPAESYYNTRDPKTGNVIHFRAKGEKYIEATEEDFMENLANNIRKGIVVLTGNFVPPYNPPTHVKLKKDHVWKWNTKYPYQGWYQYIPWQKQKEMRMKKGNKNYYPPPKKYRWKGGD